jgi:hypothetical protein
MVTKPTIVILIVLWSTTLIYTAITLVYSFYQVFQVFNWYTPPLKANAYKMMGNDKLVITMIKYIP